jgi:hypothetical protein
MNQMLDVRGPLGVPVADELRIEEARLEVAAILNDVATGSWRDVPSLLYRVGALSLFTPSPCLGTG